MGVLRKCHRKGIGRRLFAAARDYAVRKGYEFFKIIRYLQRSCKAWFVIVFSETGKQPEEKEQNRRKSRK